MLQLVIKVIISLAVILTCTFISKRYPSLAGLISVMPLTGLLVLVWVYYQNNGDSKTMTQFTAASCWGILPSILFFLVAGFCFRAGWKLWPSVGAGAFAWLAGAVVHQLLLNRG